MVFSIALTGCGKTEDKTEGTDIKVTPAATTETTDLGNGEDEFPQILWLFMVFVATLIIPFQTRSS